MSKSTGTDGTAAEMSASKLLLGLLGLRFSSNNMALVGSFPGATGDASRACRAEDSSPRKVKWSALAARFSAPLFLPRRLLRLLA